MSNSEIDVFIEFLMKSRCAELEKVTASKVFFMRAPMQMGIDDIVRREIEIIAKNKHETEKLVVVLETTGGSIEVVERISEVFRHNFSSVEFIIPNFAYSAGTVLALSGDEIYMDYYSVLGPIDPQIMNKDGRWVPGLGYIEKYNSLIEKSRSNSGNGLTKAELEFLIRKFDPAELFALEQAKEQSKDLISRWLQQYKFKEWTIRESSSNIVTSEYKKIRAEEIAEALGNPTIWNSHGRGIPLRILESDTVKLKIKNFGLDDELRIKIKEYYDLLISYCTKMGVDILFHSANGAVPFRGK
jgi:Serine dehydrogenase proteinase